MQEWINETNKQSTGGRLVLSMENHPRHVRKANLQEITNNNTVEIANRLMNNTMMSGKKSFINKKPNFFFFKVMELVKKKINSTYWHLDEEYKL